MAINKDDVRDLQIKLRESGKRSTKRWSVALVVSIDLDPSDLDLMLEGMPGIVEVVNVEEVD